MMPQKGDCLVSHLNSMKSSSNKKEKVKFTAGLITQLLRGRHKDDLFIPECKNGSTWLDNHVRFDAYAMKKSYKKPLSVGYEIKVSRSDFLNDEKWHKYLEYCNEFYFVCPTGLIDKSEVPAEAGLMYVSKTGTKLFTKKKAPWRECTIPEDMYRYILYSRTKITKNEVDTKEDRAEIWANYLKDKDAYKQLGYRISRTIDAHVKKVEKENNELKEENRLLQESKEILESMGISMSDLKYSGTWRLKSRIEEILNVVPKDLMIQIDNTIKSLHSTRNKFEQLNVKQHEYADQH